MSEYIVNFGDKSSAFVGLAMAEAKMHGASIGKEIVRCRDCANYSPVEWIAASNGIGTDISDVCHFWHGEPTKVAPDGFCAWGKRREP